jgi:DNA-binding transcriptional regulator YdaS (Cro superfamily)
MNANKHNKEAILKAIEILGSANKLCLALGVSYQTILSWKNQRSVPSAVSCLKIEKATEGKITRKDILPDFPWGELVQEKQ